MRSLFLFMEEPILPNWIIKQRISVLFQSRHTGPDLRRETKREWRKRKALERKEISILISILRKVK